jgi:branched-chain amino acid transport system substrate-binding protein
MTVGYLGVNAGAYAAVNTEFLAAAQLAAQDAKALGVNIKLVPYTDDGSPAGTIQVAREAVQQGGAKALVGFFDSAQGAALQAQVGALGVLAVDPTSSSDALRGASCNQNYFLVNPSDAQYGEVIKAFTKTAGVTTWDTIANDYSEGHTSVASFDAIVTAQGQKVSKSLYAPLNTTDYGTYITQLGSNPAQGLYLSVPGLSDQINLYTQQLPSGLFKKYKVILSQSFAGVGLLPTVPPAAIAGIQSPVIYDPAQSTEAPNKAFVAEWTAKTGHAPDNASAISYTSVMLLADAIQKAKSTSLDQVRAALSGLNTTTIFGPSTMRAADHQLLRPMAVIKVAVTGGKATQSISTLYPVSESTPPVNPACHMGS